MSGRRCELARRRVVIPDIALSRLPLSRDLPNVPWIFERSQVSLEKKSSEDMLTVLPSFVGKNVLAPMVGRRRGTSA